MKIKKNIIKKIREIKIKKVIKKDDKINEKYK